MNFPYFLFSEITHFGKWAAHIVFKLFSFVKRSDQISQRSKECNSAQYCYDISVESPQTLLPVLLQFLSRLKVCLTTLTSVSLYFVSCAARRDAIKSQSRKWRINSIYFSNVKINAVMINGRVKWNAFRFQNRNRVTCLTHQRLALKVLYARIEIWN